jgi:hypothetical protein
MAIAPISIASATAPNWLKEAQQSLAAAANPGGLMGALQNSRNANGSVKSFLATSQQMASGFALSALDNLDATRNLTLQQADAAYQKRADERLAALLKQSQQPTNYTPPRGLDSVLYFPDGSTLDTVNNIFTTSTGKQIDATTGNEYVDESSLIRMASGAYLDTKNNILMMADGTKIDTITGLVVSTSA